MGEHIDSYEDVTVYGLTDARRDDLVTTQNECTFMWVNRQGWPIGVIMSYVFRDGRVWLTASGQRKRIAAVRRDPRVSICISSAGTALGAGKTVTFKGRCTVHDDVATKAWFYPALAEALYRDRPARQQPFVEFLDSPRRVVLEVVPEQQIAFDGDLMDQATVASLAARA